MVYIHRVTYDPQGGEYNESTTPIVDPMHKTKSEFTLSRWWNGWIITSPNQVAKVDRNGYLDVVTYLETENEQ